MTVQLCRVDFEPVGKRVEVPAGGTLLDAAHAAGIELASVCGGHGHCGRCRLTVLAGDTGDPAEADRSFLSQPELDDGQRLACQTHIAGGVRAHVPRASLVTSQRLQIGGLARDVAVEAEVREWTAEPAVLCQLSPLARRTGWRLTAYLRGQEIVGVAAPGRRPAGLAVDLGTTKIAGYLVDLETGEELAADGVMNPQIAYGEDVIARLAHAARDPAGSP